MSDRELREQALARLSTGVDRAVLAVDGEQVVVHVRGGELRTLCTCERAGCTHARRAIAWVAGAGDAGGEALEHGGRSSRPPPPGPANGLEGEQCMELAAALDDVLLAVVRTGVSGGGGPSVRATLEQLAERVPRPMPAGLRRWIGRLEVSLHQQELGTVARLLEGAGRFADDLRTDSPSAAQHARMVAWLGGLASGGSCVERLTDRTFVEIGREHITGVSRRSLERRYLVDVQSFEVFREEREVDESASLGPCPRVVQVGLAEVETGGDPRRVRLLQYAVGSDLESSHWGALREMASRSVHDIAATYVQSQTAWPGVAEPFMLFAPEHINEPPLYEPVDAQGEVLPIARAENAAFADVIRKVADGRQVLWLAGRITDAGGTLLIRPISLAYRTDEVSTPRLWRVA